MQRTHPTIIPTLRYKDPHAALEFLHQAFGFVKGMVVEEDGIIQHAQMSFGNGMIMLSTARENEYGQLLKLPGDIENFNTQSPFIIVDNARLDAHYQQAKSAGAKILIELVEEPHGRGYTCADPEGHLWNFGSYDPWQKTV